MADSEEHHGQTRPHRCLNRESSTVLPRARPPRLSSGAGGSGCRAILSRGSTAGHRSSPASDERTSSRRTPSSSRHRLRKIRKQAMSIARRDPSAARAAVPAIADSININVTTAIPPWHGRCGSARALRISDRTVAVQAQRCRVSWMWADIQARWPLPDTPVAALRNRPRPGLVTKTHIRSLTDNGKRGGCPAIGDANHCASVRSGSSRSSST
jgi:hypothetical protein